MTDRSEDILRVLTLNQKKTLLRMKEEGADLVGDIEDRHPKIADQQIALDSLLRPLVDAFVEYEDARGFKFPLGVVFGQIKSYASESARARGKPDN